MEALDTTFKYAIFHRENQKWLEAIAFYSHEIDYFLNSLKDVKDKNTASEVLNNTFIYDRKLNESKEDFNEILENIKQEEWSYDDDAQGRDFLFGEEIYDRHAGIREKYSKTEKEFIETKHEFYKFLSKVI